MPDLDLLDRKILYELDLNARASASQLAKKLRRSKETVNFRLKHLLEEGYLKGFYTVFNTSKLGWFYYKIYFKFKDITPQKEKELFEYIAKQPKIAYLASMEGHYDGVCLIMSRSSQDLVDFLYPFMNPYGNFVQEKQLVTLLTTHRLNQKFLHSGGETKDWHYPIEMGGYGLDDVDKEIMQILSTNARMPLVEIAKKAGVDVKVVKYRMKKLEKDGIIIAYVTSPNFGKLGLQFAQINISLKELNAIKSIISYFDSTNRCLFALEMVGAYDLAVELHVEGNEQLNRIIDGFREKFVGKYADYDVSTITKEYVVVWAPFAWEKKDVIKKKVR
jgi:Lrp/AsnC family transcriptional regulator for asnA, asnC and gidA